jgi:signal transduction histidine kinase
VSDAAVLDRLREHAILGDAPTQELEWLVERGELLHLEPGEILTSRVAGVVGALYVVLDGHLAIYVERGRGRRKVMEWFTGDVTGVLPYSRMKASPGTVYAETATDLWAVHRDHVPALPHECPDITARLVHVMTDRARSFTSADLQDEKTLALGRLAAGLAHELNNPASAIVRTSKALAERLVDVERAARALGAAGLTPNQEAAIDAVRDACLANPTRGWSTLERADREDDIAAWIEAQGGDALFAEPLAETAVTVEQLAQLAGVLEPAAINAALRWIATGCATRALALEIEHGASRVFDMVSAVKGFTHMDRAMVVESVDVGAGLRDTVTVLRSKAGTKAADVTIAVDGDLPQVQGMVGELNQIWASLIDNALDAIAEGGAVAVSARRDGRNVVVEIIDDGPGIPAEVRERIFDPFFTTKEVGQSVGLGLDVVRRSLERHDGSVDVESRPGRTVFRVRLPAEGVRSTGRFSRETQRIVIEGE